MREEVENKTKTSNKEGKEEENKAGSIGILLKTRCSR